MTDLTGIQATGAEQYRRIARVNAANSTPNLTQSTREEAGTAREADRVDISAMARRLAESEPGIRRDLVDRVRADIASGTYDTPDKLEKALNGLIDDIELIP